MISPVQHNVSFRGSVDKSIMPGVSVRNDYKQAVSDVVRIQESTNAPIAGGSVSEKAVKLNVIG